MNRSLGRLESGSDFSPKTHPTLLCVFMIGFCSQEQAVYITEMIK